MREIGKVLARESLLESPGPEEVAQVDYEFHLAVAVASGNDVYPLLINSMKNIYKRILDRFYTDPSVVPEVFRLHRLLAAAIGEGQAHHAAETMREILDYGERNLRRILSLD
jgi:DNA-binding FadR family transcriptional regulator